jgi:hypothetical protein
MSGLMQRNKRGARTRHCMDRQRIHALEAQVRATSDRQISLTDPNARSMASGGRAFGVVGDNVQVAVWGRSCKLWRGRTTYPEVFETARDASKATAKVACGCKLCFNRLSRAVGSGQGAGSVGRATDTVGYEDLRLIVPCAPLRAPRSGAAARWCRERSSRPRPRPTPFDERDRRCCRTRQESSPSSPSTPCDGSR